MNEEELSISSLPVDGATSEELPNIFGLARECMDEACGYWSLPPPEFLLPPPPKPPFLMEECGSNPLASAREPDLTGFPSAVVATSASHVGGTFSDGPFDVCDNFAIPEVIDSKVYVQDHMFNFLVIIICSVVLVAIILSVTVIIWRRYYYIRRSNLLVNKSTLNVGDADFDPNGPNPSNSQNQNYFNSMSSEGQESCHFRMPSDCGNWKKNRRRKEKPVAGNSLEMAASPPVTKNSCHVYTNPNYPHSSSLDASGAAKQIEIGGLPFYLPSGRTAETSLTNGRTLISPRHFTASTQQGDGYTYEGDFWQDSTFSPNNRAMERPRPYFPPPPPPPLQSGSQNITKDLYEGDDDDDGTSSAGPIYEDIDRQCTYRGPPLTSPEPEKDSRIGNKEKGKRKAQNRNNLENPSLRTERIYYNLPEGQCEAIEPCQESNQGHVIVNPMMSPAAFQARMRTMSPGSNTRTPHSPLATRLTNAATLSSSHSTPTKSLGGSSMYYYSDTLKHNSRKDNKRGPRPVRELQNGRVDSDSGISVSRDFHFEESPSMRQQILMVNPSSPALTSLTSSPSSSPLSTSTASPSTRIGCTSPIRGCTSPNPIASPRSIGSQKQHIPKYI